MCGIVGLYLKNSKLHAKLGELFTPMLVEMTSRGPDSAGVALYRDKVRRGLIKLTLAHDDAQFAWKAVDAGLEKALKCDAKIKVIGNHALLVTDAEESRVTDWLNTHQPQVRVVGSGQAIEIFKEVGLPIQVAEKFKLRQAKGSHAIGHTRMATESAVTTAGSHPFATGADLCLVHNGSLSNHNRLREELKRQGLRFKTENDTEVAAAYLTWQLRQGKSLKKALAEGIKDLDGFYTFCVGTADGFAVVRDPIACKHAVLAETEDWVAMATEYRAIAQLPGAEAARIWEPAPQTIYSWGSA
ncbi:MAG TPA: glutamine amidotransferase family protein [Aestuariivirgaceae bacterium]|jgi:glutamate synthase domain-containing protein 1